MHDTLFSVAGQVVVVSGGSRGIGRAIAEGFARRGARVILTGRQPETVAEAQRAMQADGLAATGFVCDVTQPDEIEPFVQQIIDRHERIDTLVNVAGVNRRKRAETFTADDYDFILDTNLKGAFLLAQAVGKRMIAAKRGSQIHIASLNTDRPLKGVLPYAMSKAGIAAMTRGLAMEWGPHGIRVNGIAPGFILTDLTRKLWSEPTMQAWNATNCPLGRLGTPEDMVGCAIFLASPAAAFLTGQTIYIDGGFTAGWSWPIPLE